MEKFVEVMLYFHWFPSIWERANIFRYRSPSRKMVVLFVNIGKQEKKKQKYESFFMKYLQIAF